MNKVSTMCALALTITCSIGAEPTKYEEDVSPQKICPKFFEKVQMPNLAKNPENKAALMLNMSLCESLKSIVDGIETGEMDEDEKGLVFEINGWTLKNFAVILGFTREVTFIFIGPSPMILNEVIKMYIKEDDLLYARETFDERQKDLTKTLNYLIKLSKNKEKGEEIFKILAEQEKQFKAKLDRIEEIVKGYA